MSMARKFLEWPQKSFGHGSGVLELNLELFYDNIELASFFGCFFTIVTFGFWLVPHLDQRRDVWRVSGVRIELLTLACEVIDATTTPDRLLGVWSKSSLNMICISFRLMVKFSKFGSNSVYISWARSRLSIIGKSSGLYSTSSGLHHPWSKSYLDLTGKTCNTTCI